MLTPYTRLHEIRGLTLELECVLCRRTKRLSGQELLKLFPPDMLVMLVVEKFYCEGCSSPGRRVRPFGRVV